MSTNLSLYNMLIENIESRKDSLAIIDNFHNVTYGEVGEKVKHISQKLNDKNIDKIGIYIDNSSSLIYGIWSAIAADLAYIPLAVEYPDLRIKYIIDNSNIKYILTTNSLKYKIQKIVSKEISILTIEDLFLDKTKNIKILSTKNYFNDTTYIIFTSGSTGAPKGVSISPLNIINQLKWLKRKNFLGSDTRILHKTPIGFDAAQWEILSLAAGSCIIVGCVDIYKNVDLLIEYIDKHKVNTLQCVPTLLSNLVIEDKFSQCLSLDKIFSGGEKLTAGLCKQIFNKLPKIQLINLYGPTETTINASYFEVKAHELPEDNNYIIPLGVTVDNVKFRILDKNLRDTKQGEIGELYISGLQNSKGYYNREDLTTERFIKLNSNEIYYKTGDLCFLNQSGNFIFKGRIDNQVKLRGYRVELDEINASIESHPWVKNSATTIVNNNNTDFLISFVELNQREAALMDSNVAESHHKSKKSRTQVKAQLNNNSSRTFDFIDYVIEPPVDDQELRKKIFSRKNYRFYEGDYNSNEDINNLLNYWNNSFYHPSSSSKPIFNLVFLNKILYWLSAFNSEERLLYKYSYASPGALYATQIYLEINKIQGLSDGYYYFNQIEKTLHKVADCEPKSQTFLNFHFIGDQSAIKNVYQNNVKEVLEIETGHLVGSIDALVNKSQYALKPIPLFENLIKKFDLNENHYYIRSFKLVDLDDKWIPNIELLIQENNSASMPSKITWIRKKQIKKFKCDLKIEKNDVIAINQSTYERSMLGISIISRETDPVLAYIALGIGLDVIQRNDLKLGFMSSGYSSKSDNNLPSTFKLYEILKKIGVDPAPTYFCVGGKISQSQIEHEGMNEDSVHIDGPAEIIKNEISKFLPKYMIPNQIIVVKKLPLNPSGKVSYKDLYTLDEYSEISLNKPYKMPSTETEIHLSNLWSKLLNIENVSALDDFFQIGGNSLNVIKMITHIYNDFQIKIKAQDIFQYSSLNILAKFIDEKRDNKEDISSSRVIYMNSSPKDLTNTVICWPGLGGYPLKMKNLAKYSDKKFIAIQSYGLNADEKPYKTINDMALADIMELEKLEIDTPLSLWGYSFGAKIAFEVATILEKKNKKINELVLICPGNPLLDDFEDELLEFNFKNKRFVAVLLSVFFGKIDINMTLDCIDKVNNINEFNDYVYEKLDGLELSVIERITNLILKTYQFDYKFENISKGDIGFPIKIIKAKGDDYTFINTLHNAYRDNISMIDFDSDHYNILNQNNAKKLVNLI